MSFYSKTEPTAQKHYQCFLCARTIKKGEKHIKWVGVYWGDFFSTRQHVSCEKAALENYTEDGDWENHDPVEFKKYILKEKP